MRPSVRCHWRDCEGRAFRAAIVNLIPKGASAVRPTREVPLCEWHHDVVARTGNLSLAYHPDDFPGTMLPAGYEPL